MAWESVTTRHWSLVCHTVGTDPYTLFGLSVVGYHPRVNVVAIRFGKDIDDNSPHCHLQSSRTPRPFLRPLQNTEGRACPSGFFLNQLLSALDLVSQTENENRLGNFLASSQVCDSNLVGTAAG